MNNRRWLAQGDCLVPLGRCIVDLLFLAAYICRGTQPQTVLRLSLGSPALGYDFERVTVQVQRLVEALRESKEICPKDVDPASHSQ